jgi:hypothetical protein
MFATTNIFFFAIFAPFRAFRFPVHAHWHTDVMSNSDPRSQPAPSAYEINAWARLQAFQPRPIARVLHDAGERVESGVEKLAERTEEFLAEHPSAEKIASGARTAIERGKKAVVEGSRKVQDSIPAVAQEWLTNATHAAAKTLSKVVQVGLSASRVVEIHQKAGHQVTFLHDLRRLDLSAIDKIGKRGAGWYYPSIGAIGGAGAGLAMTGGEIVAVAGAGATAAPSVGVIAAAFSADAALVYGLAARSVAHVGLLYGYDPDDPAEKLFVMSIINAGTAATAGAKTAAFRDISKLTQALVRNKTWEVLNESIVSKVATKFAEAFGQRLTKQGLGKLVPAAGIVLGGAFNWSTLESIFDRANHEYRRRFLLEKYPLFADSESAETATSELDAADDVTISVIDEISELGGPNLGK